MEVGQRVGRSTMFKCSMSPKSQSLIGHLLTPIFSKAELDHTGHAWSTPYVLLLSKPEKRGAFSLTIFCFIEIFLVFEIIIYLHFSFLSSNAPLATLLQIHRPFFTNCYCVCVWGGSILFSLYNVTYLYVLWTVLSLLKICNFVLLKLHSFSTLKCLPLKTQRELLRQGRIYLLGHWIQGIKPHNHSPPPCANLNK